MRLSGGQWVALAMAVLIIGIAIWRLVNSTQIWWTIAVVVMAVIGVGLFIYYMLSGGGSGGEDQQ